MFYFLLAPSLIYHWLLVVAAVVPAIFLMIRVYRSDRLEKESPATLWRMALGGIIAALIALVSERLLGLLLDLFVDEADPVYNIILYFVIVACSEEGAKFFMLRRRSWNLAEFNCQYDGVVYAVFVSLGFALWENISYVLHYGFTTALVRALTAIPGHACFGVFMGIFYGLARGYAMLGENGKAKVMQVLAVALPALLHGVYDYVATVDSTPGQIVFIVFVAVLFTVSFLLVGHLSKKDRYFKHDKNTFYFDGKTFR